LGLFTTLFTLHYLNYIIYDTSIRRDSETFVFNSNGSGRDRNQSPAGYDVINMCVLLDWLTDIALKCMLVVVACAMCICRQSDKLTCAHLNNVLGTKVNPI